MAHTIEKPYQCPQCVKSFIKSIDMQRHMMTHTGEKTFKCDQCDKCFMKNSNLKGATNFEVWGP